MEFYNFLFSSWGEQGQPVKEEIIEHMGMPNIVLCIDDKNELIEWFNVDIAIINTWNFDKFIGDTPYDVEEMDGMGFNINVTKPEGMYGFAGIISENLAFISLKRNDSELFIDVDCNSRPGMDSIEGWQLIKNGEQYEDVRLIFSHA